MDPNLLLTNALDLRPVDIVFDSSVADGTSQRDLDNPTFSLLPGVENCVGMALLSAQVPFSYYVIDYTCNTFNIRINTSTTIGGGTYTNNVYTVSLLPGTYTRNNLKPMLTFCIQNQTTLVKGSGGNAGLATDLSLIFDMRFDIDDTTSSLLFYTYNSTVNAINESNLFNVEFGNNSVAPYIGFANTTSKGSVRSAVYDNSDSLVLSNSHNLYSPFAINLSGPSYLFLHSEKLSGAAPGTVRNSSNANDIVAYIPVNNNYQGTIEFLNPIAQRIPFTKCNLPAKIDFRWTLGSRTTFNIDGGTNKNYLQLQGQAFLVVLRFYVASSTTQIENMNRFGDKYTEAVSQNTGAKRPNETVFSSGLPPRRKIPRANPTDPNTGKPMPQPSSQLASRRFF